MAKKALIESKKGASNYKDVTTPQLSQEKTITDLIGDTSNYSWIINSLS